MKRGAARGLNPTGSGTSGLLVPGSRAYKSTHIPPYHRCCSRQTGTHHKSCTGRQCRNRPGAFDRAVDGDDDDGDDGDDDDGDGDQILLTIETHPVAKVVD